MFSITDLLARETRLIPPRPKTPDSMSPPPAEPVKTPEPKSSGLVSVFKSLTGSKSSKSTNVQSPVSIAQRLGAPAAVHGGPPDFEQFHQTLKTGTNLSDRVSAAEALRHAVQDYPVEGVSHLDSNFQDI
jgi:hypothetical protein